MPAAGTSAVNEEEGGAAAGAAADEALRKAMDAGEYEALSRGLEAHRRLASEALVAEACTMRDRLREKRKKESQKQVRQTEA